MKREKERTSYVIEFLIYKQGWGDDQAHTALTER